MNELRLMSGSGIVNATLTSSPSAMKSRVGRIGQADLSMTKPESRKDSIAGNSCAMERRITGCEHVVQLNNGPQQASVTRGAEGDGEPRNLYLSHRMLHVSMIDSK